MNKANLKAIATLVRAVAKQIEALELTDAKMFDRAAFLAPFAAAGMPDTVANSYADRAEKEFAKIHGDGANENRILVRDTLVNGFNAIATEYKINAVKAAGERKPGVRLTEEDRKKVIALREAYFAEKAKPEPDQAVIMAGQLGNIAQALNVTTATISNVLDAAGLTTKRTTTDAA